MADVFLIHMVQVEGVCGIRPLSDFWCNVKILPFFHKQIEGNLEGEYSR